MFHICKHINTYMYTCKFCLYISSHRLPLPGVGQHWWEDAARRGLRSGISGVAWGALQTTIDRGPVCSVPRYSDTFFGKKSDFWNKTVLTNLRTKKFAMADTCRRFFFCLRDFVFFLQFFLSFSFLGVFVPITSGRFQTHRTHCQGRVVSMLPISHRCP